MKPPGDKQLGSAPTRQANVSPVSGRVHHGVISVYAVGGGPTGFRSLLEWLRRHRATFPRVNPQFAGFDCSSSLSRYVSMCSRLIAAHPQQVKIKADKSPKQLDSRRGFRTHFSPRSGIKRGGDGGGSLLQRGGSFRTFGGGLL